MIYSNKAADVFRDEANERADWGLQGYCTGPKRRNFPQTGRHTAHIPEAGSDSRHKYNYLTES